MDGESLVKKISELSPSFGKIFNESVQFDGEPLSYLIMAEYVRHTLINDDDRLLLFQEIEKALVDGDEDCRGLIILEVIQSVGFDTAFKNKTQGIGPHLEKELVGAGCPWVNKPIINV